MLAATGDAAEKVLPQANAPLFVPGIGFIDISLGLRRDDELIGHSLPHHFGGRSVGESVKKMRSSFVPSSRV